MTNPPLTDPSFLAVAHDFHCFSIFGYVTDTSGEDEEPRWGVVWHTAAEAKRSPFLGGPDFTACEGCGMIRMDRDKVTPCG